METSTNVPKLIDSRIYSYLNDSLNHCHSNRVINYYYLLNISIAAFFIVLLGVYFYCSWKIKPSPEEMYQRSLRDKEHVLNQIRVYQEEQSKLNSLTHLPILERKRGEQELAFRPTYVPVS